MINVRPTFLGTLAILSLVLCGVLSLGYIGRLYFRVSCASFGPSRTASQAYLLISAGGVKSFWSRGTAMDLRHAPGFVPAGVSIAHDLHVWPPEARGWERSLLEFHARSVPSLPGISIIQLNCPAWFAMILTLAVPVCWVKSRRRKRKAARGFAVEASAIATAGSSPA
jgi:hypothetical protein